MSYSYNDFMTKAKSAGMLDRFSQEDLAIAQQSPEYGMSMLGLMQDEQSAATAEGRLLAQEAVKALRNNYSLKSQATQKQAEINALGSFAYSRENDLQKLEDEVANRPEFSYDKEQDPIYKALRSSAIRDSQRAVEDTLARASVGTGGVPSSYAVTAAQQAANNYLGKLDDAVPTLYQNALAEYESDLGMDLKRLATLEGDKETEYKQYLDQLTRLGKELEGLKTAGATADTNYLALLEQLREREYSLGADGRPTGLLGHGLLVNTGNYAETKVTTNAGKTGTTKVPVMQAQDGSLWYWDHMQHKYIPALLEQMQGQDEKPLTPDPISETENTTLFRNVVMSPREFAHDRSEGKEASYNAYILETLKRWHEAKKISDSELAWLVNYYGV